MLSRDHQPVTLGPFKGVWSRGDPENTPLDYFQDGQNLQAIGDDWETRDGLGISQDVAVPLEDVVRIYNYPTQTANTLLVLTYDGTTGRLYHVVDSTTIFEILVIVGMEDFAYIPYAGRAYISPFATVDTGDINQQKGLENEFLYTYLGDGVVARKAAGTHAAGTVTIANGGAGHTSPGFHIFGVVGETDSGYLSAPIALNTFTTLPNNALNFSNIPIFTGSQWTKRHLVASLVITNYDGNINGYQLFFIPEATINDNVTTTLNNVSFFDEELLEDASHLSDNYQEIPAGAALWLYHDRLCLATTFDDISLILVSAPGEPEAISELEGLCIFPLDGNPITNGGELRDTMYVFKRSRTGAFVDNGDVPSSWPFSEVDNALGTCVHGISTVLDSGKSSVDYFVVCNYAGIYYFNGKFDSIPITRNIETIWNEMERNDYRLIQIVNCPPKKQFYVVKTDGNMLVGNYANGVDLKSIRWMPWTFSANITCVGIVNIDEIILGADV